MCQNEAIRYRHFDKATPAIELIYTNFPDISTVTIRTCYFQNGHLTVLILKQ